MTDTNLIIRKSSRARWTPRTAAGTSVAALAVAAGLLAAGSGAPVVGWAQPVPATTAVAATPADAAEGLRRFASDPPRTSLPAARVVSRDLYARTDEAVRAAVLTGPALPDPTALRRSVARTKGIVDDFEAQRRRDGVAGGVLKTSNLATNTLIGVSLAAVPTTAGASLAIGAFTVATSEGLDYVLRTMNTQSEDAARIVLGNAIDAHIHEHGLNDLTGLKPDEILERLTQAGHPALDPNLDRLQADPQALAIAQSRMMKILARTDVELARNLQELAVSAQKDAAKAHKTQEDLANLSAAFSIFAKTTEKDSARINTKIKGVTNDLRKISKRVDKNTANIAQNTRDIAFLQDALYGQMSGAEQKAFLEAGALDGRLTATEKAERLKLANIAKRREEMVSDLTGFVNGAYSMKEIAKTLGVDVPPDVATAVEVSTTAANAAIAFVSGNPLGGVVALTSLLGGRGGPDPAAIRHQQIMAEFSKLREGIEDIKLGQVEIKGMILQLQENDRRIMENQRVLLDTILQVSDQVQRSHEILSEKIDQVGRLATVNIEATMALRWNDLKQCGDFLGKRDERPDGRNGFASYAALAAHFEHNKPNLKDCLTGYRRNLVDVGKPDSIFALKFRQGDDPGATSDVDGYIQSVYLPIYALVVGKAKAVFGDKEPVDRALASLAAPAATVDGLHAKVAALTAAETFLPDRLRRFVLGFAGESSSQADENSRSAEDLLGTAIAPVEVGRTLELLLDVYWYYDLVDDVGTLNALRSVDQVLTADEPRVLGRRAIRRALILTDLAIAQAAMMSGDLTVLLVWDALEGKPTERPKALARALERNPLLAGNVLLYGLIKRDAMTDGTRNDPGGFLYRVALASDDPQLLRGQFGVDWGFERDSNDRWYARLAGVRVPMPDPKRFERGAFVVPPELQALVDLRARLLDAELGYGTMVATPSSRREQLGRVLIGGL